VVAPNLTRETAAQRSAILTVENYLIELDLTDGKDAPGEETFSSKTTVTFTATAGASSFIDIVAARVHSAVLNGTALDVSGYDESTGMGFWAVEVKTTGEFLGWFHLRPGDGHETTEPELGYRLRRSAWGQGYATEGGRALIDKAFAQLGVRRVLAETMTVHTASRRVMERCGLRLVREFHADWPDRIPGDEHGDVEYAIDREEWELQRPSPR